MCFPCFRLPWAFVCVCGGGLLQDESFAYTGCSRSHTLASSTWPEDSTHSPFTWWPFVVSLSLFFSPSTHLPLPLLSHKLYQCFRRHNLVSRQIMKATCRDFSWPSCINNPISNKSELCYSCLICLQLVGAFEYVHNAYLFTIYLTSIMFECFIFSWRCVVHCLIM